MATPSPGYSITVRVEATTDPAAIARLSSAVTGAGGAITALDVAESQPRALVVDVSRNAGDTAHADEITAAIEHLAIVENPADVRRLTIKRDESPTPDPTRRRTP